MVTAFWVVLALLLCPLTGSADEAGHSKSAPFTKHYAGSLFKVSDKGLYSVEMVIKEKELRTGVNTLDIIVHDRNDKDIVGADITMVPWMPEMGHGVFEKPVVKERGGGLYTVEDIILIMGGHWELRINIRKSQLEDSVTFDFPDVRISETLPQNQRKMLYSSVPSDLDTSTTRTSEKKLFKVSYESESQPIAINKIHRWKLKAESADGQPLKTAEITVSGDMPEHGHGLPTKPEVSKAAGDGNYVVQGLKFSMPGWWVITFQVKDPGGEDSVAFNLIVQ